MNHRKLFIIFVLGLFLIRPVPVLAAEALGNAGIIKSGIWYSKDPFYSGEKVRIYTLIFNGSEYDLLGEVAFDDNGKVICTGNFNTASGRTQEIWCDWTATGGSHKISAKIINPKIAPVGESPQSILLDNNVSGVSLRDVVSAPKKIESPVVPFQVSSSSLKTGVSSSTGSAVEKSIVDGLTGVKNAVLQILPDNISSQDVIDSGDKIASVTPKTIRDSMGKLVEKLGGEKMKAPFTYLIDFFVAIYNFIVNDPLLLVIIAFFVVWKFAKYIYRRLIWPQ